MTLALEYMVSMMPHQSRSEKKKSASAIRKEKKSPYNGKEEGEYLFGISLRFLKVSFSSINAEKISYAYSYRRTRSFLVAKQQLRFLNASTHLCKKMCPS